MQAHNPVGWFEIYVNNIERATKFYETILATKLTPLPMPDGLPNTMRMMAFPMESSMFGASGALVQMEGFAAGGNSTIVYFSSVDCAIEAGRVIAAGGTLHQEKISLGQYGFMALAMDTEGNMFGIHSMK
jgi:predicted enzyme related to lactoylglutathione lyase